MARAFRSGDRSGYQPLQLTTLNSPEIDFPASAGLSPPRSNPPMPPSSDGYRDTFDATNHSRPSPVHGLGLPNAAYADQSPIRRVPVGSKNGNANSVTFSPAAEIIESPVGVISQPTTAQNTPLRSQNGEDVVWPSPSSSRISLKYPGTTYRNIPSEVSLLQPGHSFGQGCPTSGDVLKSRWTWYCYAIISLALFSTVFSGIFLGIALRKPRWNGLKSLRIETATLLSALFSKLIELSFACVFVATLGQILSRRAFAKTAPGRPGGVSIAEMNMRLWILQPGTLLTHWTGAWFALKTALGIVVLLAAIAAALYITAAEALVSPKLAFGKNETRQLVGKVTTMYANAQYLSTECETPVTKSTEGHDEEGPACLSVKHAGQGYRNFGTWLTDWGEKIHAPIDLDPPGWRPPPVAMMFDNTTVQGQWIYPSNENITVDSERYGRLVHNVTLAMPHANVVHAVRDARNRILQPEDLRGDGEYYVDSAVPAPILNILCVGMTESEVNPMIMNASGTPDVLPIRTPVDDIFGIGKESESETRDLTPWFSIKPDPYNMVVNISFYGQKALYILSASPNDNQTSQYTLCAFRSALYPNCTTSYHVAQSGSNLAVHCSYGSYNDVENSIPYSRFNPAAPIGAWSSDWTQVATTWATSVALSQGISRSNASISRILLQMTPKYSAGTTTVLDPKFPSLSEGFGALAASTLLLSSDNSPFAHMWNYTGRNHFEIPQDQNFASILFYKDYASGNSVPWQGVFYLVLLAVFLLNLFCLCYLLWKFYTDGEVTDYTEPQNLFALAINSPPSHMMSGSCGPGPNGDMLCKKWMVDIALSSPQHQSNTPNQPSETQNDPVFDSPHQHTDTHPHFYVRCPEDDVAQTPGNPQDDADVVSGLRQRHTSLARAGSGSPLYQMGSPPRRTGSKWWSRTGFEHQLPRFSGFGRMDHTVEDPRPKSVNDIRLRDWRVEESPAVQQYKRLTNRR